MPETNNNQADLKVMAAVVSRIEKKVDGLVDTIQGNGKEGLVTRTKVLETDMKHKAGNSDVKWLKRGFWILIVALVGLACNTLRGG